ALRDLCRDRGDAPAPHADVADEARRAGSVEHGGAANHEVQHAAMVPEVPVKSPPTVEQKTLGRYKILSELGRGAMGAVYRAVDPLIEREVMDEVRERFIREARSAGRLNHPNIVTVFDVGEQDGVAYIAMELLEGRSLQDLLKQGRLPFEKTADLVAQVADALD